MTTPIPGISKLRAKQLFAQANQEAPGLSDGEIAKRLGMSRSRVYQVRLRAIAKFKQAVLDDPELRELAAEVCGRAIA